MRAMRLATLFLLTVVLCGCFGPPREVIEPEGVRILRDLTYATVDGAALQLDLYLPDDYAKPLPLVVWIHGGGWVSGQRSPCPIARLATRGYAVASISYRLAQGVAVFPAQLHDCKAAVRWLRTNAWRFGCDGERIGVWGASAGGHLAALLGTVQGDPALEGSEGVTGVSSRVQCVVALFPATDFVHLEEQQDDHWRINFVAKALLHGPPQRTSRTGRRRQSDHPRRTRQRTDPAHPRHSRRDDPARSEQPHACRTASRWRQ